MEKSWKITLADGTKLENLSLNGNNFVSENEITEDIFNGNLLKVKIEGKTEEGQDIIEEHNHMELIQITKYDDGYYFALRDLTEEELEKIIWEKIKEINKTFPPYKYIKNMILTDEELIKTTTQKVKRNEEIKRILGR